jgi:hypothetical protein
MSLASCSSDSESTNESNDVLVKKIAFNAVTDEYSEVVQYTYNVRW